MSKKFEIGKARRESMGISASTMAEEMGCATQTVYNYEAGKTVKDVVSIAYWTVLERLTNGMSQEERKIAELRSRISTLSTKERPDIKISNLANIIKVASNLIDDININERKLKMTTTQSSLSVLTRNRDKFSH